MAATEPAPRVLVGNIFFSPTSFGGATVVAENMALNLKQNHGWDVMVCTSLQDPQITSYGLRRYSTRGIDAIGIRIPDIHPFSMQSWDNPEFTEVFGEVLDVVRPDIVHMHSIQNMGADCLNEVARRGIPLAVTVHDYWFVCERQFMINHAGRFCNQAVIDKNVCRYCVTDIKQTERRTAFIQEALGRADVILYPSKFHRDFHVDNGFPADKSLVNRNGIRSPGPRYRRSRNPDPERHRLRFGFVGGPGPIKGASLLARAFSRLKRKDYQLVVVDAANNVGQSWRYDPVWSEIPGDVVFIPAYDQDTIDKVFADIDVLLFPSQWKESFGLTVREAMVRGIWVVVTEGGGLAEDCVEGKTATIIPLDGQVRPLMDAIESLLKSPPQIDMSSVRIATVEDQASELDGILRNVVGHALTNRISFEGGL